MRMCSGRLVSVGGVFATALLSFSLVACAGGQGQASQQPSEQPSEQATEADDQATIAAPTDTSGGSPWIDSNLKANIKPGMETSPKDDFYLYTNYDWLLNAEIPAGDRVAAVELGNKGREHAMAAVSGEDLTNHDARQAQLLYRVAADTEARDAAGVEPAQATIDDIRSLATIEDVAAFLLDSERSAGAPSLVQVRNRRDPDDGTRYVARVNLSPSTIGSSMGTVGMDATMVTPDDPLYQARLACASAVLTRAGLTEEEAKTVFENRMELERRIVQDAAKLEEEMDEEAESPRLKLEELDAFSGTFPLRALAEAQGYGAANEFLIDEEASIRAACALFTQDNIELIRDYLLGGYALEVSSWLDSQTFEAWRKDYAALGYYDQLASSVATPEETAFDLTCAVMPTPVGRAYVEAYNLEHTKEFVESLCKEAIEAHKECINASEWLSDASKEHLTEKLDGITIHAVYPEVWEDYSGLNLDGLSYYEARRAVWLYDIERNAAYTNQPMDARLWNDPSLINSVARYNGSGNEFVVAAGAVDGPVASYEAGEISLGELIGSPAGYCIFHEIGHSLDSIDLSIDKDGNPIEGSLLDPTDLEEYERRIQKALDYYDSIVAFTGQNVVGKVCLNEGLTEVSGLQAALKYAAHQDIFDYEGLFRNRALMRCGLRTPEFELQCILGGDSHPSAYLDVNGSAQQFEEFYETYGVQEGDGMYLAPEDRIPIW